MSMYQEIQRCKRIGYSKVQTAKKTGLARGTVRKFWSMNEQKYAHFRLNGSQRKQRFDPFREEIIELLEQNYADGQEVYASSVYDVLEERHEVLPAGGRTLRNYIRFLHESGAVTKRVFSVKQNSRKLSCQCPENITGNSRVLSPANCR